MNKGFTLIEAIIYTALLGLLMAGAVAATYQLLQGSSTTSANTTVQDEGNFVVRKLDWALTGMNSAPAIGGSGCAQTISIIKNGFSENPVEVQRDPVSSMTLMIREGGTGPFNAITTTNVSVSCLRFRLIPAVGGAPPGVTATTTINGLNFVVMKYLRK